MQTKDRHNHLTKSLIEGLPLSDGKPYMVRDTTLPGFGVIVGKQRKSYFVERRMGNSRRRVFAQHPLMATETARRQAQQLLAAMAQGLDPRAPKKGPTTPIPTLAGSFANYLAHNPLRDSTKRDYRRVVDKLLSDWAELPLTAITRPMVRERFLYIGQANGKATANLAMRVLRAIYNAEIRGLDDMRDTDPDVPALRNPVDCLRGKDWFKILPRRTVVLRSQRAAWFAAVQSLRSDTQSPDGDLMADYLLCCILTGLRRKEVARMRWRDVDLEQNTIRIPETKNGIPLLLPIPPLLRGVFALRRRQSRVGWVFRGSGAGGHLVEPKRAVETVRSRCGFHFTIHDLRRTFITVGEELDVSRFALKCLVNHGMGSDITDRYTIPTVDRLRDPARRITEALAQDFAGSIDAERMTKAA